MTKLDELLEAVHSNLDYSRMLLCAEFEQYLDVVYYIVNESEFIKKPFHKKVVSKLEDIVYQRNAKRNLGLNIPVGSGKSLIVEYFISWCFARSINHTFIYLSHSDDLISKLSKETKEICEHPEWIRIFGQRLKKDAKSKTNWSFDGAINRTGLMAGTVGGGVTGLDAGNPNVEGFSGALIIDDPVDVGKIRYPKTREECIEYYTDKLETRRRTMETPTILIMQRLHKGDLSGHLQEAFPEDWDFVTVQAYNEKTGESFWPERYSVESLQKMKNKNPYLYTSQYQQEPITKGGNVIQSEWFEYYPTFEDIKPKTLFMTADTAQKKEEKNDYTVFCWWFVYKNSLHLLDMFRKKMESPELRKMAVVFWDKWKRGMNGRLPSRCWIEDKSSGTGLIQDLKRDTAIPVFGVQVEKDKLTRLEDVLPYIECGRVKLYKDENWDYNPTILAECEGFARDLSHSHDDIVDNFSMAIKKGLCAGEASVYDNIT